MLVTVSGPPGVGKSTVSAALAEEFGYEHVSGGDVFRALAEDAGLSLAELNARAEEDPSIDRDLDRRLRETARDRDDVVLESRLAGWMAGDHADLKVWLDAPLEVRAVRIAEREGMDVAAAREETAAREESERRRYEEYYGIDFTDTGIYDLNVNTSRWSAEGVIDVVAVAVDAYDPDADEGPVPVADVEYEF